MRILAFVEERPGLHTPLQQTNKQTLTTSNKNLNLNKNVSVKHLSLICFTSILTTIYSLENCTVYGISCRIYSPKLFGFFRKEFR